MPIYEYQGQQFDIPDKDPLVAKAKILSYLGQATNPEAPAAETFSEAGKVIAENTPESVKKAAAAVGQSAERLYGALPDVVQQGLKSSGNAFMDVLEYLNRPGQTVLMGAKEMRQLERENPPTPEQLNSPFGMLQRTMNTMSPKNSARVQQAALAGLKGEAKTGFVEALPADFRKENPVTSAALGIAGDILLGDKAGYAPLSAAKAVATPAIKAMGVPKVLSETEFFKNYQTKQLNKAQADEIYSNYQNTINRAINEAADDARNLNLEIKSTANTLGIPVKEFKAQLVNDIEKGSLGTGDVRILQDRIIEKYKNLHAAQVEAGIPIGNLGETYMPHIRTAEIDDFLNLGNKRKPAGYGTTPHAKARTIEESIQDINAKKIYGQDWKTFRDDPAVLQGVYEYNATKAIAGKKLLNDARELGVANADAPANYVKITGIDDVMFPPEVASRIKRIHGIATGTSEFSNKILQGFFNLYDGITDSWKKYSLGVNPAYHTKNEIGNLWNNYLGGLTDVRRYKDAAELQNLISLGSDTGRVMGKPVGELREALLSKGIIGGGQYGSDIAGTIEKRIGELKPMTLGSVPEAASTAKRLLRGAAGDNIVVETGRAVGTAFEDNARIALFLDQVKKGKSYDEAAKHVNKYLFDYIDISPVEQRLFKRVMPFYTWSRKNIPLQLESLVTSPEKANKINILRQNLQAGVNVPDQGDVSEQTKAQMPIYIGNKNPLQVQAIPLQGLIPLSDLSPFFGTTGNLPEPLVTNKKIPGVASTLMSNVAPQLKSPAEYILNYDFFRKKSIEEYKGQKTDFLGIEMPVHLAKVISNVVGLSALDRANPAGIFGEKTVDPLTKQVTASTPSIFGVQRESRTDNPEEQRYTQALTGVRVMDVNPTEFSGKARVSFMKDIQDAQKLLTQKGAAGKSSELKAINELLKDQYAKIAEYDKAQRERKKRESISIEINGVGRTE